jgi:hypothetical protein
MARLAWSGNDRSDDMEFVVVLRDEAQLALAAAT